MDAGGVCGERVSNVSGAGSAEETKCFEIVRVGCRCRSGACERRVKGRCYSKINQRTLGMSVLLHDIVKFAAILRKPITVTEVKKIFS